MGWRTGRTGQPPETRGRVGVGAAPRPPPRLWLSWKRGGDEGLTVASAQEGAWRQLRIPLLPFSFTCNTGVLPQLGSMLSAPDPQLALV